MVRELGFMRPTLAETQYSPSAVHTLLEIESSGALTAAQLVERLGLEKSSVSRMLAKLIAAGELQENVSEADARVKKLFLTPQGINTVKCVNHYAAARVMEALAQLDTAQQHTVAEGLSAYATALGTRHSANQPNPPHIEIVTGYHPGMIGRIAEMHGRYYAQHHQFGYFFEGKVASGLAEFANRLAHETNQIWLAVSNGNIVGSVAIDGEDLGNHQAHLRWFILDDSCRGTGIGRKLLTQAMAFCDAHHFHSTQLWTFSGLDAARRLYEDVGFYLTQEWQGDQWGKMMTEQQFTREGTSQR
jgi:Transcriptional regulators